MIVETTDITDMTDEELDALVANAAAEKAVREAAEGCSLAESFVRMIMARGGFAVLVDGMDGGGMPRAFTGSMVKRGLAQFVDFYRGNPMTVKLAGFVVTDEMRKTAGLNHGFGI